MGEFLSPVYERREVGGEALREGRDRSAHSYLEYGRLGRMLCPVEEEQTLDDLPCKEILVVTCSCSLLSVAIEYGTSPVFFAGTIMCQPVLLHESLCLMQMHGY